MAEDRLTIDHTTIFDNVDERRVEFAASISGETYDFALLYDVLEAMTGQRNLTEPVALVMAEQPAIERIGVKALARDSDRDRIIISENDLE